MLNYQVFHQEFNMDKVIVTVSCTLNNQYLYWVLFSIEDILYFLAGPQQRAESYDCEKATD